MKKLIALLFVLTLASGCTLAQKHREAVTDDSSDKVTIATVQREIKNGMSAAEVVEVLGAPNMVALDKQRRETWVYDKVSYLSVNSSTDLSGSAGLYGVTTHSDWAGSVNANAGANAKSGASSYAERTITVIIKFDAKGLVRDYTYRQTSF